MVRRPISQSLVARAAAFASALAVPAVLHAAGAGGARPNNVVVEQGNQAIRPATPANEGTPSAGAQRLQASGERDERSIEQKDRAAQSIERADATIGLPKSQAIMRAWQAKHPDRAWEQSPVHTAKASPNPGSEQQQTYGAFTERDEALWAASYDRMVARGKEIFHSGPSLGTTVAISCDMCHPDAANTHAETYPKYQVQLGRMAMLRDMINWCLQNPVRGKPLADNDERLKALEAYVTSARATVPLAPGKH